MSNIFGVSVSTSEGPSVIEEGTYDAVLTSIIQTGLHPREYKGEQKTPAVMMRLVFEIPELTMEINGEKVTRTVGKEMPASISERSNFFKYLKAMGAMKEPTNDELNKVFGTKESVEKLLGSAVSVNIAHFAKDDGTKIAYLESISKLDPRLPQPEAVRKPYIFTFSDPDIDVFKNQLSPYIREKIMSALNVKELGKEFHEAYIAEQEAKNSKQGDIL